MISFAAYAFNKSHAACYAVIAYQTAYLKYYYPVEFMAAMLTSVIESDKLGFYCNSVQKEMGIPILPPDFNESEIIFTATDEGQIRFGLSALKGVGKSVIGELMAERENGSFKSFYDFAKRMAGTKFNKKAYEAMIKAGAFDSTEFNRRTLMENYDKAVAQATQEAKSRSNGQMSLFDLMSDDDVKAFSEPQFKLLDEYGEEEKLKYEREVTNLFISGHPLNKYTKAIQIANAASIGDILESIEPEYIDGLSILGGEPLDDNNVEYELRDIKLCNPTLEELTEWYNKSGLPLKKFFNTSGLLYKSMELKTKLPTMTDAEMLKLLATDGMLVKRPILVGNDFVLVGFKES
jgi:DNA polymerase-3 subunit alpha